MDIFADPFQLGIWTHYSGSRFEVIYRVPGANVDDPEIVVYRGLRSNKLYYRPIDDFLGNEDVDGYLIPRFTFTGELTEVNQG